MSYKTAKVAYYTHKVRSTNRQELLHQLQEAPLTDQDREFMTDIISGYRYKELAEKYHKSLSRIYQWKRTLYELLTRYDMNRN